MKQWVFVLALAAGLLGVGWVGWGFVGASALALAVTLLIGVAYALGVLELARFSATSAALRAALQALSEPPAALEDWLQTLPPALREPVRQRVEGERGALPGLALAPYLVGLLVMLGMLGTFLGMVLTFKGAVFALEGSTELAAIRAALAAPIKGLGLSFGTSVAGVASSALLGLLSALCRRERLQVSRLLDSRAAGVLRPWSLRQQRQAGFAALQAQSQALPQVAERLLRLSEQLEQRQQALALQLQNGQDTFHREAAQAHAELAASVGRSLQHSLAAGVRAAGDSVAPVVQAALAGLGTQAAELQQRLDALAQAQVAALEQRFAAALAQVSEGWQSLQQQQAQGQAVLTQGLERSLATFSAGFEQRSLGLIEQLQASLRQGQQAQAEAEQQRLQAWLQGLQGLGQGLQTDWQRAGEQALAQQQALSATLERTAATLGERSAEQAARAQADLAQLVARFEQLAQARIEAEARSQSEQSAAEQQRLQAWGEALGRVTQGLQLEWQRVGEQSLAQQQALSATLERTAATLGERSAEQAARAQADLAQLVARFEQLAQARIEAEARAQSEQAAAEQQRLQAWGEALGGITQRLQTEWRELGEQARSGQQQLCRTLEQTSEDIGRRSAEQAGRTLAELAALVAQQQAFGQQRAEAEAGWLSRQGEQMDQVAALWRSELAALRADETERGAAALQRLEALQQTLAQQLATLGQAFEAPMARLMQQAAEVPQAVAGLLAQWRGQMDALAARDEQGLQERAALLERLNQLLQAVGQATADQQQGLQALTQQTLGTLGQAGSQFSDSLASQAARAEQLALHLHAGAIELSSLGQAFQLGAQQFSDSNQQLAQGLQRVEAAIGQSSARSDEQLAYYVAQAREVVDLSISAQRGIIDELRRLHGQAQAAEAGSA